MEKIEKDDFKEKEKREKERDDENENNKEYLWREERHARDSNRKERKTKLIQARMARKDGGGEIMKEKSEDKGRRMRERRE